MSNKPPPNIESDGFEHWGEQRTSNLVAQLRASADVLVTPDGKWHAQGLLSNAADEIERLTAELAYWQKDSAAAWDKCEERRLSEDRLRALLRRYRTETPLGHQPHMIAHEVDEALAGAADETDGGRG